MDRIALIHSGVPAVFVNDLARSIAISKTRLYEMMGIARPTIERKLSAGDLLGQGDSERILRIGAVDRSSAID